MTIEHPAALLFILPVFPAVFCYVVHCRRALSSISNTLGRPSLCRLAVGISLRTISWILIVLALANVRKERVPSQSATSGHGEAGDAVALVFDISYSMNALDAGIKQYKVSRLDAAAQFARMMMVQLMGTPISVVLAKGDGLVAVPLTADYEAITAILATLSPSLMSATGTRLGQGIEAAESAFPNDVAYRRHIWLFTDGDETDGALLEKVEQAVSHGNSVMLLGFGSEAGTDIMAGDGKTQVHTALRSDILHDAAMSAANNTGGAQVRYIAANSSGCATALLSTLSGNGGVVTSASADGKVTSKNSGYALLSVLIFAASIIVVEITPLRRHEADITATRMSNKTNAAHNYGRLSSAITVAILFSVILMGCKPQNTSSATLRGAWAWRQGQMQKAASYFLHVLHSERMTGNAAGVQYALYNIAATYIALGEYDAAISCMDKIADNAPMAVQFATAYNRGVIAFGRGEYGKAMEYFRAALTADSTSIAAKENLEIATTAQHELTVREREKEMSMAQAGKVDSATDAIFEKVREQDQKQWTSRKENVSHQNSADY